MRNYARFFAVAALWLTCSISFAGELSNYLTIKSEIRGYQYQDYILTVEKGTELRTKINKDSLDVILFEPIEADLNNQTPFILPKAGQYTLRVLMPRAMARRNKSVPFELSVQLTPAINQDKKSVTP